MVHVFLPSFIEISKVEVTKMMQDIHQQQLKVSFWPFSPGHLEQSCQNLCDHSFPIPIPLPSFAQIHQLSEEIYAKCVPASLQY